MPVNDKMVDVTTSIELLVEDAEFQTWHFLMFKVLHQKHDEDRTKNSAASFGESDTVTHWQSDLKGTNHTLGAENNLRNCTTSDGGEVYKLWYH